MLRMGFTLVWLAGTSVAVAAVPLLNPGVDIQAAGLPLQVSLYSAPAVVDWNCDGKKDLLVGQFTSGAVYRYLNTGTDANPVLGNPALVQSGGTAITTSYG